MPGVKDGPRNLKQMGASRGSGSSGGGRSAVAIKKTVAKLATPPKLSKKPGKPPTLYHGTSWNYKKGDITKSRSATTSYSTAKSYAESGRAVRGPWPGGTKPPAAAGGKPTVYKVTPANGKATAGRKDYYSSKREYVSASGYKIVGKATAPIPKMKTAAKPNPKPRNGNRR